MIAAEPINHTTITPELKQARLANSLMFLVCGLGVSSWAPLVPLAKSRLALDNAGLGLLLLFFGAGAMVTMPVTGRLISKWGSRSVVFVAGLFLSAALPLLLLLNSPFALGSDLFLFGASIGSLNVAMNSQALIVQNKFGRHIMSSFHGLFSVGGLLGSLVFGFLIKAGISPIVSICCISIILLSIVITQVKYLLTDHNPENQKRARFYIRGGQVLTIGFLCVIIAIAEGAMLDWSAVFLRFDRNISPSYAGVGYAMFSISMAIMRLTGDQLINFAGRAKVILYGSIIASAGLILAVSISYLQIVLMGFLMIGIGCANIIPILFTVAGKVPGTPATVSLPVVTTMTYGGILAGPALIGFAAQLTSLPLSLGIIGVSILFVGLIFKLKKF